MLIFELVVGLLLVGVLLALFANRIDAPYPAMLALGGACLALVPGAPHVRLDPELALALFVSPVLLDAAFDASPRDIRANLLPVSTLAVVVVGLTIAAVAAVAHALVPGMTWAPAVALGAIVAPPDASAATTVLKRLRPPHRLVVILEGESLFNDASALLVYRIAVAAALTGTFSTMNVVTTLLLTCVGGVVVGIVLARLFMWIGSRIEDIPMAVLTQFLSTFAVWILADRLRLSAIVTLVAYAMTLARLSPGRTNAQRRIASYAVWDVAVLVLNVLAFILIGLQLRPLAERLDAKNGLGYALAVVAVCATVIVVRLAFWMAFNWLVRMRQRTPVATVGSGLVIAWCGMRGIVTLAAALALPAAADGGSFPQRDFIVLAAFCVVLSTLVLQGLSLRPLLAWVGLKDEGSVERELQLARVETARAAFDALAQSTGPAAGLLRREYAVRLRAQEVAGSSEDWRALGTFQRLAVSVQRARLVELRAAALIGDDAFHAAEAEIDLLELSADGRVPPEAEVS